MDYMKKPDAPVRRGPRPADPNGEWDDWRAPDVLLDPYEDEESEDDDDDE